MKYAIPAALLAWVIGGLVAWSVIADREDESRARCQLDPRYVYTCGDTSGYILIGVAVLPVKECACVPVWTASA